MILQEIYKDDPWKLLVGCILLNQTTREQVDEVRDKLFEQFPTPEAMYLSGPELTVALRSLGLQNRRSKILRQFCVDWIDSARMPDDGAWPSVDQVYNMCGVGKYALDSYKIFVLGWELKPTEVDDKVLKKYLELHAVV